MDITTMFSTSRSIGKRGDSGAQVDAVRSGESYKKSFGAPIEALILQLNTATSLDKHFTIDDKT